MGARRRCHKSGRDPVQAPCHSCSVRRSRPFVVFALGGSGLLASSYSLEAKEHAASCDEIPGMIVRVRATLEAAMYQRHRGSSLGAYQVLHSTTISMAGDAQRSGCGALGATLATALRRAGSARTALEASVELDVGLETSLSLAMNGRPPLSSSPPKLPPVAEAAIYGAECPDLYPVTLRLDGPPDGLASRVSTVLADLRDHPRCERVRKLLEGAKEGAKKDRLNEAVDSIRLDEPDPMPADDANPLHRCPEFPIVFERLSSAIAVGAPRYNAGDANGCRRLYEETARKIAGEVIARGRCPVVRGLLEAGLAGAAASSDASDAAWALRRSFDAVLEGPRSSKSD
jgi:hypothetical protein